MRIKILLLFFLPICEVPILAQQKILLEGGITHPLQYGDRRTHLGYFFKGLYLFPKSPLGITFRGALESYNITRPDEPIHDAASITLLPALRYTLAQQRNATFYASTGVGFSINNEEVVDDSKYPPHVFVMPEIGMTLWKTLNISVQYHIAKPTFSRLSVSIGFFINTDIFSD